MTRAGARAGDTTLAANAVPLRHVVKVVHQCINLITRKNRRLRFGHATRAFSFPFASSPAARLSLITGRVNSSTSTSVVSSATTIATGNCGNAKSKRSCDQFCLRGTCFRLKRNTYCFPLAETTGTLHRYRWPTWPPGNAIGDRHVFIQLLHTFGLAKWLPRRVSQ